MAFKAITGNAIDLKKTTGAYEGTYTGKNDITTKIGPQVVYNFLDKNDQVFSVYGFTNLNRAMNSVHPGNLVRLTYQGTKNLKTKYGMKDVHQVLVEVDDEAVEKKNDADVPF